MRAWNRVWTLGLRPALLLGFGIGVCLYCGRRGYMPLDQSIVFDGGWRILCGQVPFRDYVAPNGFPIHALQAIFFALFGVNWFAYCLHAALVNGLFTLCVDRLLRVLGAPPALALPYAAASALVLAPPLGVPYMDTHAFFFSAVAIWLAVEGRLRERRGRGATGIWAAAAVVLGLAGLSKQIPSAFALAVVVAIAAWDDLRGLPRRAAGMAAGGGGLVAALAGGGLAAGVDPGRVVHYFFTLPASEGPRRLAEAGASLGALARDLLELAPGSLAAVQIAFVLGLARARRTPGAWAPAALAQALLGVCLAFAVLTLNQVELALPYLFLAVGLAHIGLRRLAAGAPRAQQRALRALGAAVLIVALFEAGRFHERVNLSRVANDIRWDPAVAERAAPRLPDALAFLQWQVPRVVPYDAADLAAVADFLGAQDRGFLLLGDASILYGLTGHESAGPALWYHPGLTLPRPNDPGMRAYEDWLLERMESLDVRYLVLEGRETWNHVTLDDFPRLSERVRHKLTPRRRFGGFRVVDLVGDRSSDRPPAAGAAQAGPAGATSARTARSTRPADTRAESASGRGSSGGADQASKT